MPVRVTCTCGKVLRVNEKSVGKRVKCPGCGKLITASKAADATEPAQESDSETFEVRQEGKLCSCGAMMRAEAVICIKCGFDSRTGSRHQKTTRKAGLRKRRSSFAKALDSLVASPALLCVWGVLFFCSLGIALYGLYSLYELRGGSRVTRAIGAVERIGDHVAGRGSDDSGVGTAFAFTIGGFAGCGAFGWLARLNLKRGYDAMLRDLRKQANATTDPKERAELETMIEQLQQDKKEMERELG